MRAVLLLAVLVAIDLPVPSSASPRVSKIYAANGRRVAVIKDTAFGRKVYGPNGRRISTIRGQ